jgi:hypothetical protein
MFLSRDDYGEKSDRWFLEGRPIQIDEDRTNDRLTLPL